MNLAEYLLTSYIEELSELQKEIAKCIKFTHNNRYEGYQHTNLQRARFERFDLKAVEDLLFEQCGIDLRTKKWNFQELLKYDEKKQRTIDSFEIAKILRSPDEQNSNN